MKRMVGIILMLTIAGCNLSTATAQDAVGEEWKWWGGLSTLRGRANITFNLRLDGEMVQGTYDVSGPIGVFFNLQVKGIFRDGKLLLFRPDNSLAIEAVVTGSSMEGEFIGKSGSRQTLLVKRMTK